MSITERWTAAHSALAAHSIRLDGHDLDIDQAEAMAAIADKRVDPAVITSRAAAAVAS